MTSNEGLLVGRRAFLAASVTVALALGSARPTQAGMDLVSGEGAPAPVLYRVGATGAQQAAGVLAGYLTAITGRAFPTSPAPEALPERAIVLEFPDDRAAGVLGKDGYRLWSDGQRLRLQAGSAIGFRYGVYGLLEDRLGCRWWSWNEEDVATHPAPRLDDFDMAVTPGFSVHDLMNREAENPANEFRFKCRSTSQESFTGSHNLYRLLSAYGTNHPGIYPQDKDGQRKPNNLHFCYLAPGIAEALADSLAKQVETSPAALSRRIYFAGMGDWYGGMCLCPTCQAVYEEETWTDPDGRKKPGYAATLLRMINRAAELLEARYAGVRVGTLAYMSLEAPPALTVPRANVIIRVPRLRHCTVHAASECGINASYLRNLERWCELAPGRVYIWEYGTNFKSFLYPFPCLTSIAANLRLYRRMGVAGVTVQGNYVTMGSDLVVLKNYVWRHVLWEPSLATEDLVREFCAGYYGPAAEAVASYVTTLEDGVRRPSLIHADEFAPPSYLTPEVRRALAERRLEALRDAGGRQPYLRRVKEATAGIEVLALDGRRPFVERPGCLTRSGAGDDAWERALDVMGHVRNSGNNEWTTGQTYWLDFLGSQGGPLVTLQRGPLRVSVAPLLGGQLRRLEWGGRNLLSASLEPPAKGFPETGGSAAVFGGGTRFMRIVGSPTDERLTMDNAFVIEGSRFLTPATHTQTVELASDREVTIALTPAAKAKPAGATVTTVYAIGGESNGCEVAVEAAGGEWQAVALAPAGSHVILTDVAGCRLGFRAAGLRVVDRYLAPDSVSLKIGADAAGRALTVVAETSPLDRRSSPAPPLLRQLTVEPVAPR